MLAFIVIVSLMLTIWQFELI